MPRGSRSTQPATNGASPVPSSSATVMSSPRKPKFVSRLWQRVVHSPKSDENQSSRPLPAPPRYPSFASSFEWVPDSAWFLPGRSTESLTPTENAALNEWLDYEPSPIPHTGYNDYNESPTVHNSLPAMPRTKKDWVGTYLILYNTVTTFLWSYLLVLVFFHLFLAPTVKAALLNPIPQAATYPTASSFIRSRLQKVFSLSSPPQTSPASKTAAGVTSTLGGIAFALVERARATYSSRGIGVYTAFIQSAAILEVVHALLGWTKSQLVSTMMQVASRLIVVWWIGEGYETARSSPFYTSMLVAWCFAEIIRNVYYISSLLGLTTPSHYFSHSTLESARHQFMHAVTWLRYTAFYVLYPVGAGSEYALIFASFPSFPASIPTVGGWTKANKSTSVVEGLSGRTTRWVAGWGWDTWAKVPLVIIWPASLYILMSHMHAQRRKAFGKGSSLVKKAKVA